MIKFCKLKWLAIWQSKLFTFLLLYLYSNWDYLFINRLFLLNWLLIIGMLKLKLLSLEKFMFWLFVMLNFFQFIDKFSLSIHSNRSTAKLVCNENSFWLNVLRYKSYLSLRFNLDVRGLFVSLNILIMFKRRFRVYSALNHSRLALYLFTKSFGWECELFRCFWFFNFIKTNICKVLNCENCTWP